MDSEIEKKYIGLFDSGVGGLTVLHHALEILPHEHFLYYADIANVPYGTKSRKEIVAHVDAAIEQMMKLPLKAIVLACNTATSVSATILREKYDLPIIGMEPAIKPAVLHGDPRKILVLATELTLKEEKFLELVKSLSAADKVDALPMQELVNYAEEYDFDSPGLKRYLRHALAAVDWSKYHSVVLGCTHFLYFKLLLKEIIPSHIQFVDGHKGTINHLSNKIVKNPFGTTSELKAMLSGIEVATEVIMPYLNILKTEGRTAFSFLNS